MAVILRPIFPTDKAIQPSEGARAAAIAREEDRRAEAERLRTELLDSAHTSEIFAAASMAQRASPDDLMPTPDEVAGKWGSGNYEIYEDMRRNVLCYGALQEGIANVMESLPVSWLPGMKGDAESETVTAACQSAWESIDERGLAITNWSRGFEAGFSPVENIWGVHTRGAARDLISVVQLINRPVSWFGFDYTHRPRFKSQYMRGARDTILVPEHKVSFLRYGSNHTPYGRGTGQYCYPAVWTLDMLMKGFLQLMERYGYLPAIVTYPNTWKRTSRNYVDLKATTEAQWKNVFLIPGEVDSPKVTFETSASSANANASGTARLNIMSKLETWLAMFLQGSQYSPGGAPTGSNAREQTADAARMWKAPGYASCLEATINRGFTRPTVLVNYPQLDEAKYPRAVIDAAAGEDLDQLIRIFDSGTKLGVRISAVTWSEKFKIPIAREDEEILSAPAASPQLPPGDPSRITDAGVQLMGEQAMIELKSDDGKRYRFFSDDPVYVEGRGAMRAGKVGRGMVVVLDPRKAVA